MKCYRGQFKSYLDELGKKVPAPGGGSAVALILCLGVSLIEKSINYSVGPSKEKLKGYLPVLRTVKQKAYGYVDLDGQIFKKILKAQGKKKKQLLSQSESILIDLGKSAQKVFSLAKARECAIKKNIISDFRIGGEFLRTALFGCLINLEANQEIFGRKSKYILIFKRYLKKWPRY